jgi:hypothetical protein
MLPWMGVAWFDIRKHPSGNARRVILTKPFEGPYTVALILGLSPEKPRDSDLRAMALIVDLSKVQFRNDSESLKNYRI